MNYFTYSKIFTLFDDDSTKRKLECGADKWEVMVDDGRNPDCTKENGEIEEFLKVGKTYKITVLFRELH